MRIPFLLARVGCTFVLAFFSLSFFLAVLFPFVSRLVCFSVSLVRITSFVRSFVVLVYSFTLSLVAHAFLLWRWDGEAALLLILERRALLERLEVLIAVIVEIIWLVAQDFLNEIAENVAEAFRHRVLFQILACHLLYLFLNKNKGQVIAIEWGFGIYI